MCQSSLHTVGPCTVTHPPHTLFFTFLSRSCLFSVTASLWLAADQRPSIYLSLNLINVVFIIINLTIILHLILLVVIIISISRAKLNKNFQSSSPTCITIAWSNHKWPLFLPPFASNIIIIFIFIILITIIIIIIIIRIRRVYVLPLSVRAP